MDTEKPTEQKQQQQHQEQQANNQQSQQNHHSHQNQQNQPQQRKKLEGPKRDAILKLEKYFNKEIEVTLVGGRSITGILKGFDQLMNLVLNEVVETFADKETESRKLGLVVVRGPLLLTICPMEGYEVIENPYSTSEHPALI